MFYCPYAHTINGYYRANQMNSSIRVFHASPNTPNVDIYANGNLIVKDLAYNEVSKYITVTPGNYNITVYSSGQTTNPIINTNVDIPANTIFNVAAIGTFPDVSLYPIQEPTIAQNFGRPCIRFVHLSHNAPAVDIKLSNGIKVFTNVGYKGITDYACVPTGTYTFTVSPAGTDNVVLTIPNVKLDPNNYYTIYAIGLAQKSPPLEGIVLSEPR